MPLLLENATPTRAVCFTSGNESVTGVQHAFCTHTHTHNISAQIFIGYCGRKPKHGAQWHQT